jgi:hypothetical protein
MPVNLVAGVESRRGSGVGKRNQEGSLRVFFMGGTREDTPMRIKLTAGVLIALAAVSSPAVAQDKTIGGVVVPPEQLEAVQMKCEELIALKPVDDTQAANAPAAGASDNAATTESTAETPVEPAATETPASGNMAADTSSTSTTVAVTIDLATLTAELCEEGGFKVEED